MKISEKPFKEKIKIISADIIVICFALILSSCSQKDTKIKNSESPVLRFVCVYSGNSDYFKYSLKEGLDDASKESGNWVRFVDFKSYEIEKHCEELDKAIVAKVDGIITNIPDAVEIKEYLDVAYNSGIPVIAVENESPDINKISFIGINSYDYGVSAAKQMISATGQNAATALFKSPDLSKQDLKNQGFLDTVTNYPSMKTELFSTEETSIIGYTNTAQSIFVNNPYISSFFCPDTESTLGVLRAMIEFNKTDIVVVGSGDSKEILKYIKSGLIYSSLVENPYTIGYLSVDNLLRYKNGESISESINPDILIISGDNIDYILEERKDTD